jgi:hypothetical protein
MSITNVSALEVGLTLTEAAEPELRRLRERRAWLESERDRVARELEATNAMILPLLRLRPDLATPEDRPSSVRPRDSDLGRVLEEVVRTANGRWLTVPEAQTAYVSRVGELARAPTSNQVRDSLRYLAKTRGDIDTYKDERSRLLFRVRLGNAST